MKDERTAVTLLRERFREGGVALPSTREIEALACRYDIPTALNFETRLLNWADAYHRADIVQDQRPSPSQTRREAEAIRSAAERLTRLLRNTTPHTLHSVSRTRLDECNSDTLVANEMGLLKQLGEHPDHYTIDLAVVLSSLAVLTNGAQQTCDGASSFIDEKKRAVVEKPVRAKGPNAVAISIRNLARFWQRDLNREFTCRLSDDRSGPANQATAFAFDVLRAIAPDTMISSVETAMQFRISEDRSAS